MSVATLNVGAPDAQVEAWLREHGVDEFDLQQRFKIAQIDPRASLQNQARFDALDEDHVIVVAEAMSAGTPIPPIVVVKLSTRARYKVLDGNHRWRAAELIDRATLPAYVITQALTETQERLLIATANTRHPKPNTMSERLSFAAWLIEHRGTSQIDAARMVGVPVGKVRSHMALLRAGRRIRQIVGVNAAQKLGHGAQTRLDALRSDEVLSTAASIALDAKLSQVEINDLVTRLNKLRSERSQMEMLVAVREELAVRASGTARKVSVPRPLSNLNATLSRILRIDIDEIRTLPVDDAIRKDARARVDEAASRLKAISEVL